MTPSPTIQELQRLDQAMAARGILRSRTLAQTEIKAGRVLINGAVCSKVSTLVAETDTLTIQDPEILAYVSRGALKLVAALDKFAVNPSGMVCLDIGASTGGFTDCLLQRGAQSVLAIDVGQGQLVESIRLDKRVESREHVNARDLQSFGINGPFDLIVIDVAFISLTLVLPSAVTTLAPNGSIIALVKPQFEVGRNNLSKGGIVKDAELRLSALERVRTNAHELGLNTLGEMESPISGGDGNIEYLIHLKLSPAK
jgi:23S rRNA (cytidine1920-2'-O)/16S rRNA (cytidine1409-2'-O)-methyltransferase